MTGIRRRLTAVAAATALLASVQTASADAAGAPAQPATPGPVSFLLANTLQAGDGCCAFTAGDVTEDGHADLAVLDGGQVELYAGGDRGQFSSLSPVSLDGQDPRDVTLADATGDGHLDLLTPNRGSVQDPASESVTVEAGVGDGTFPLCTNGGCNHPTGGFAPESVAVGDFTGDGKPDLAVVNSVVGTVSVLAGPLFTLAGSYAIDNNDPAQIAAGDFNGDGHLDLAVTYPTGNNISVLYAAGDGASFAPAADISTGAYPVSLATGLINPDKYADLAVANFGPGTISVLTGGPTGLSAPTDYPVAEPSAVRLADVSGDGAPDIVATEQNSDQVAVLVDQPATGNFLPRLLFNVPSAPRSVAVADYNGDGDADLAVLDDNGAHVDILLNAAHAPVAVGDAYSVERNSALSVPAPGVLGNDESPDGSPLATTLVAGAHHGTLTLNSDGSFDYTPDPGFTGADVFSYAASGSIMDSAPTTVAIDVFDQAPTISPIADQTVVRPLSTGTVPFTIGDPDDPIDAVSLSATSSNVQVVSPEGITLAGSGADRTVSVTPVAHSLGTTKITVSVSDGARSTPTTFTVDVLPAVTPWPGQPHAAAAAAGGGHTCGLRSDRVVVCWGDDSDGQTDVPAGLGSARAVAAGADHSCAIRKTAGTVACWGDDSQGQTDVPAALGPASALATGLEHTCAVRAADGQLLCWGLDNAGQSDVPASLGPVTSVAAGAEHTCAILATDATVRCWGNDLFGQLEIPAGLGAARALTAGALHSCAIRIADAAVLCWGANASGQSAVPGDLGAASAVTAGNQHTCAIRAADLTVRCWGDDTYGELDVPANLGAVRSLAAGGTDSCAIDSHATLRCWGDDARGQLGAGPRFTNPATPPPLLVGYPYAYAYPASASPAIGSYTVIAGSLPTGLSLDPGTGALTGTPTQAGVFVGTISAANGFAAAWQRFRLTVRAVPHAVAGAVGGEHVCGLRTDRSVSCWGWDQYGQATVPLTLGPVTTVTAGADDTCAIRAADHLVQCWGDDSFGQVDVPLKTAASAVASAGATNCAIRAADGEVRCWGYAGDGVTDVPNTLGSATSVAVGESDACAIRSSDHSVSCWGDDAAGQLDPPADLGAVSALALGRQHSCAIRAAAHTVVCWGADNAGQTDVPADLGPVTALTAGVDYACAIRAIDHLLRCWGAPIDANTPPPDLGPVRAVNAAFDDGCAVTTRAALRCWGDDSFGQLGTRPTFTNGPPPNGTVGVPYSFGYSASATPAPGYYAVSAGALPPGLTLDLTTGVISGTPTTAGGYTGLVIVSNGLLPASHQAFRITVTAGGSSSLLPSVRPAS